MKHGVKLALDALSSLKVSYGDVRLVSTREQALGLRNAQLSEIQENESFGIGIRVLKDGAWGFASTPELNDSNIKQAAQQAVKIAEASSLCKAENVVLAPAKACQDYWATPYAINPFQVSLEEKLEFLTQLDQVLRKRSAIKVAHSRMAFKRKHQWFGNTEGSLIEQDFLYSGAGYSVWASEGGKAQLRSYPQSWGGNYKSMGYELLAHYGLLENAERIRDEAIALLKAPDCPQGKKTLILDGPQMALQIHESVGHANELDRVLGFEANFAGRSFMLPGIHKKGFRYGSEKVNLVADSTLAGGLASLGYDDDGVPAQRFHVIQDGIHKQWLTTRESAPLIGNSESNGCSRAERFYHMPITRIPNLSLMPGQESLEEMIAETKDGILMEVNRSWSIDQMRLNFQFGCELGRIIRNGKIVGICKNPTYQGVTPEFWRSCDAIGNQDHWDLWGVINCGKGQPMQVAAMSHGSSPARFQAVEIGVGSDLS